MHFNLSQYFYPFCIYTVEYNHCTCQVFLSVVYFPIKYLIVIIFMNVKDTRFDIRNMTIILKVTVRDSFLLGEGAM